MLWLSAFSLQLSAFGQQTAVLFDAADNTLKRPTAAQFRAANLDASYQPLDADLTAIAALSTTANGRSLLTASALTAAGLGLTNGAALDSWAAITRASGFDTFAATPSSANLDSLVTDDTGSGALVFATSPTLVTPVLGAATGTSLTLSSLTSGRVTYATTSGLLTDSSAFTYDGTSLILTATGAAVQALSNNGELGAVYAGSSRANAQTVRIGATRVLNYGDGLVSQNLRSVSGADTYQTDSSSVGYAGMEFFFDGAGKRGVRWIVGPSAQTLNTPFTPSYAMTLNSSSVLTLAAGVASTSTSTGTLVISGSGGLGVGGAGYFGGLVSAAGTGATSERFGAATTATASNTLAVGYSADATGSEDTAIGAQTTASGGRGVALGYGSNSTVANYGIAIGYSAASTGGIRIGGGGSAASSSIAIGDFGATSATGESRFYTGNRDAELYFGAGSAAAFGYYTRINGAQMGSAGTGGILYLAGGKGGDAASAGGSVRIQTASAGAGTTLVDRVTVASTGDVSISSTTEATTGGAGSLTTSGGIYAAKAIVSNSSTASTSTTTGSIITAGGLGVGGAIYAGGSVINLTNASGNAALYLGRNTTSPSSIAIGANSDFVDFDYTVGGSAGIRWRNVTTERMRLTDAGVLSLTNTTEASTGGAGSLTTAGGIYAAKAIVSNSSTASTSTTTGSIVTAGGVGIAKDLFVGQRIVHKTSSLTYASPTSVDVSLGDVFTVTTVNATGSVTFNATAGGVAGQVIWFIITNDATSAKTITFGSNFSANGTLTASGANKVTTISFVSNGTTFYEVSRTVLP